MAEPMVRMRQGEQAPAGQHEEHQSPGKKTLASKRSNVNTLGQNWHTPEAQFNVNEYMKDCVSKMKKKPIAGCFFNKMLKNPGVTQSSGDLTGMSLLKTMRPRIKREV